MLDKIRTHLPRVLVASGLAVALAMLALAGLSLGNPLSAVMFIVSGFGTGGIVTAMGFLLENSNQTARQVYQARSDLRAATRSMLQIAQEFKRSSETDS